MGRRVLIGLVVLCFAVPAFAGDPEGLCSEYLKGVTHFQGNDLRIKTNDGKMVFVDPITFSMDPVVKKSGMVKPDVILITHAHDDHFAFGVIKDLLAANPKATLVAPDDVAKTAKEKGIVNVLAVQPKKEYTVAGIRLETVPAYFLEGKGHPKENNWVGYVLNLNGKRYFVTGDTEAVPEMADIHADVVFPLVWGCGGNVENAVKLVTTVKAKVAVPVHTGDREESMLRFTSQLPKNVQGCYYLKGELHTAK